MHLCACYEAGSDLSTLDMLTMYAFNSHSNVTGRYYYYPYLIDEKTGVQSS